MMDFEREREKILAETGFRAFFTNYSAIADAVTVRTYSPGESLIVGGATVDSLFYIYQGRAVVSPVQTHNTASHLILEAPWFTGEVNLFRDEPIVSGIKALTECRCVVTTVSSDTKAALLNDVKFLRTMCGHFAKKAVVEAQRAIMYQSFDITQKIARYFLDMKPESGAVTLNKTMYAQEWGVSKRHIQDVVSRLVGAGVIKEVIENGAAGKSGNGGKVSNKPLSYFIADEDKLRAIAAGERQIGEFA